MTQRYLTLFAATSVAAFTLTARAQQSANAPASSAQNAQTSSQTDTTTAGASASTSANLANQQISPHADDIRRVLARVTEDAVNGKLKDVTDNFSTASAAQFDRSGRKSNLTGPDAHVNDRSSNDTNQRDESKQAEDQLKQTSKQLTDAWKAKYGHDFNIGHKNESVVYGGDTFQILAGDLGNQFNQAQTAGAQVGASGSGLDQNNNSSNSSSTNNNHELQGTARVGDTNASASANTSGNASASSSDNNNDHKSSGGTNHNNVAGDSDSLRARLAGRGGNSNPTADTQNRMATVVAQQSHGAPTVSLTLVNEGTFGNRWHIQPSAGLDYNSLAMSLNHHLQEVLNMQAQWPQDENEALKMVSHHVLAALAMPPSNTQQAGGSQSPASNTNSAQPANYSTPQQSK